MELDFASSDTAITWVKTSGSASTICFRFAPKLHENVYHADIRQLNNSENLWRRLRCHETRVLFEKEMLLFMLWLLSQKMHFSSVANSVVAVYITRHYWRSSSYNRHVWTWKPRLEILGKNWSRYAWRRLHRYMDFNVFRNQRFFVVRNEIVIR